MRLEIGDAEAATGPGPSADLARSHLGMVEAPPRDRLIVIEEELAHVMQDGTLRRRVIAIQVGERDDAPLTQRGVIAVRRVDAVRAQAGAERLVQRGERRPAGAAPGGRVRKAAPPRRASHPRDRR